MNHSDNDWEKIRLKNLLVISFVFFFILVFILSISVEDDSFRFHVILTMPPRSMVIGFISGQERADTDGTLEGFSMVKTEVKKVLSVEGQLSALVNSLLSSTSSMEVDEK